MSWLDVIVSKGDETPPFSEQVLKMNHIKL
jgi:hypothetical protein